MTWYSQAGQDQWIFDRVGSGGYFVDVGAYDGVSTSNTYALERYYGWTGICVEPNLDAFNEMRHHRQCIRSSYAISDRWGEVNFDGNQIGPGESIQARPLAWLLDFVSAPAVIDYLSIDVEGHELQVLDGMDFERWTVRFITIEHNLYRDGPILKDAIYDRLTAAGFVRVIEDVGCIEPCPSPAYPGAPFEDWYQLATER